MEIEKKFKKGDWVYHIPTRRVGKIVNMTDWTKATKILALINFIPYNPKIPGSGGDTVGIMKLHRHYRKLASDDPKVIAAKEWAKLLYDEVMYGEY